MKYSILLPYHNRREQFSSALESFEQYRTRSDFEIVVVPDIKTPASEIAWLKSLPVRVLTPNQTDPRCSNPAGHFNQAAKEARGDFLILSNPEIYHVSNILAGLDDAFSKNQDAYVLCDCLSIRESKVRHDRQPTRHMWYQHVTNQRDLHFCSALSSDNFHNVGGFDEGFLSGIGYEDDDFRESVKSFGLEFVRMADLLTYHLNHDRGHQTLHDYRQRLERNRTRYENKWGTR